jgi:hypothetical protein
MRLPIVLAFGPSRARRYHEAVKLARAQACHERNGRVFVTVPVARENLTALLGLWEIFGRWASTTLAVGDTPVPPFEHGTVVELVTCMVEALEQASPARHCRGAGDQWTHTPAIPCRYWMARYRETLAEVDWTRAGYRDAVGLLERYGHVTRCPLLDLEALERALAQWRAMA